MNTTDRSHASGIFEGLRRTAVTMGAGAGVAALLVSCSSPSLKDSDVNFTEEASSSSAKSASSFEDSPAAEEFTSGNTVGISTPDGESTSSKYRLGEVDSSTYSPDGLSWVSDDEGWVDGAASSSGSGRTIIFFIDGVQVPQPVSVAKVISIEQPRNNSTVNVTYNVHPTGGAGSAEKQMVSFTIEDGEPTVNDADAVASAQIWTTDIGYESEDQGGSADRTTTANTPSSGKTPSPRWDQRADFTVEQGTLLTMQPDDGPEIRCLWYGGETGSAPFCTTKSPDYWKIDGKPVNYFDFDSSEGNQSDAGQLWSRNALKIEAGQTVGFKESDNGASGNTGSHLEFDGQNIIRRPLPPYGDAIVLTPTGSDIFCNPSNTQDRPSGYECVKE